MAREYSVVASIKANIQNFTDGLTRARQQTQDFVGYFNNGFDSMTKKVMDAKTVTEKMEISLGNMSKRLSESSKSFENLKQAADMRQVQQSFSQVENSIKRTNTELKMLGFGKTQKEIQATEAEMYDLANTRLDNLKDQIKQTENAIEQMKNSANAGQFTEQIKQAEQALAQYKQQLSDVNVVQKIAETNGYNVANIFGKDVFVKPLEGMQKFKAQVTGFFNTDLAMIANKTYTTIDNAAKAIVGSADTAAQQKQKINQLATAYDTLGQRARLAALGVLAVGYAVVKDMPSFQQMADSIKGVFDTIITAVKPTLDSIFNFVTSIANTTNAFLQANPVIASFIGHFALIAGAATIFIAAFSPIAALLIRNRALFQALGQSMVAFGTGGTAVLNPAVLAIQRSFLMLQNAIVGFPRILAGIVPAALTALRAIPGFIASTIIQFVKLNPMLTAFSLIAMVAAKNWDTIAPIVKKIIEDIKYALQPLFNLISSANNTIMPQLMSLLNKIAQVAGVVLADALRTIEPIIRAIAQAINGDFAGAFNSLKSIGDTLGTFGGIIGVVATAWATYAAVAKTVAIAQTAINIAMNMNPIGLIITAIGALIGIGILLVKNWDTIKAKTLEVFGSIKAFFVKWFPEILAVITGPIGMIVYLIANNWEKIKSATLAAFNTTKNAISTIFNAIVSVISSLVSNAKNIVINAWNALKSYTLSAFSSIKNAVLSAFTNIKSIASTATTTIRNTVVSAWNALKSTTSNAWNNIRSTILNIFSNIKSGLSSGVKGFIQIGKDAMQGLLNGIISKAGEIYTKAKEIANNVKNTIKSALKIQSPSRVMMELGENVSEGLAIGIENKSDMVAEKAQNVADKIINVFKEIYQKQKEIALKGIDDELKSIEQAHQEKLKIYDEDAKEFEESVNRKLKAMDKEADNASYEKKLQKAQKERQEILNKLSILSLDDSYTAINQKKQLAEQLAEKEQEIAEIQDEHSRTLRKENLQNQLDTYKKDIDAKKKSEETKYNAEKKRLEDVRKETEQHYDRMINDEQRWTRMREDILKGHTQTILSELNSVEGGIRSLFGNMGSDVQEFINKIGEAKNALIDLGNTQQEQTTNPSNGNNNSDTSAQSLINRMKQNAQAWANTNDPNEKKRLETMNEQIANAYNAKYPDNPMSKRSDGAWYFKDGVRVYHDGGWVNKLRTTFMNLKDNEIPAILEEGEFVLSRAMVNNIGKMKTNLAEANNITNNNPVITVSPVFNMTVNGLDEREMKKLMKKSSEYTFDTMIRGLRRMGVQPIMR